MRIDGQGNIDRDYTPAPADSAANRYFGASIQGTYTKMVALFGPPTRTDVDCGKSWFEWDVAADGGVFTLYDWHEFDSPAEYPDDEYDFNISEPTLGFAADVLARIYVFSRLR